MRFAVVDDEKKQADEITSLFLQVLSKLHCPLPQIDYFASIKDFLINWSGDEYDGALLDIFLPDGNGVTLAKQIRSKNEAIMLVFCSTSNEFATESYDVQASYYLTKPVSYEKMEKMAKKLLHDINAEKETLVLPDGQQLLIKQVLYSEYYNHRIKIRMKDAPDICIWMSQRDYISLISEYDFFLPITPGTIINMNEVKSFEKNAFTMSNGISLFVSRPRKKEVQEVYNSFLFNQLRRF